MCHNGAMAVRTFTTVKINLSTDLKTLVEKEASRIGFSLQDFVRMMLGTYFSRIEALGKPTYEERLYQEALEDVAAGRYTTVKNKKELKKYLDSLC